jgi:DNA-binding MarR family transcriptional regulator
MSRREPKRAELLAALNEDFQQLSTATILFHQAIADRLGLNLTDHKCVGILACGPVTAGELAERTGLTTGAITGVIDRLEKAGFVRRVKDPADRRRVIVEPVPGRAEREIAPLFESMARASLELCERYTTRELAVIHDFTLRACEMASLETRKLREEMAPEKSAGEKRATPRQDN